MAGELMGIEGTTVTGYISALVKYGITHYTGSKECLQYYESLQSAAVRNIKLRRCRTRLKSDACHGQTS